MKFTLVIKIPEIRPSSKNHGIHTSDENSQNQSLL